MRFDSFMHAHRELRVGGDAGAARKLRAQGLQLGGTDDSTQDGAEPSANAVKAH